MLPPGVGLVDAGARFIGRGARRPCLNTAQFRISRTAAACVTSLRAVRRAPFAPTATRVDGEAGQLGHHQIDEELAPEGGTPRAVGREKIAKSKKGTTLKAEAAAAALLSTIGANDPPRVRRRTRRPTLDDSDRRRICVHMI